MTLKEAANKIDKKLINDQFSGKIKLELTRAEEWRDIGEFCLDPIDFEVDDYDISFEEVLVHLLEKVGYDFPSTDYWDEIEELRSYYDKCWYSNSTLIPFLVELHEDFYLDKVQNCKIDFEVMECTHNWNNNTELTDSELLKVVNYYNSNSKYFEIVSIKKESEEV